MKETELFLQQLSRTHFSVGILTDLHLKFRKLFVDVMNECVICQATKTNCFSLWQDTVSPLAGEIYLILEHTLALSHYTLQATSTMWTPMFDIIEHYFFLVDNEFYLV